MVDLFPIIMVFSLFCSGCVFPCKSCKILTHLFIPWPCWFVPPPPVLTRLVCFSPCIDPIYLFFSLYWPGWFVFLPVLTWLVCFSTCTDPVGLFFSLYWSGRFVFLPVDAVRSCRCSQMLECKGLEERLVLFLFFLGEG